MSLFEEYYAGYAIEPLLYWHGESVTVYDPSGAVFGDIVVAYVGGSMSNLELTDGDIADRRSVLTRDIVVDNTLGIDIDYVFLLPDNTSWRVQGFRSSDDTTVTLECGQVTRWNTEAGRLYRGT